MIIIDNIAVKIEHIVMLDLKENLVFIKYLDNAYKNLKTMVRKESNHLRFAIHIKDCIKMSSIKYKLIESIKDSQDPDDRVLRCEWWPDFKERDRLIELRKTLREKEDYKQELTKDINMCQMLDLDFKVLYEELESKLTGTFGG